MSIQTKILGACSVPFNQRKPGELKLLLRPIIQRQTLFIREFVDGE